MTPEERLIAYVRGRFGSPTAHTHNPDYLIGLMGTHLDIVEDRANPHPPSTGLTTTPYRACLAHGTRHRLEPACVDAIRTWATRNMPDLYLGEGSSDLYIVLGADAYLSVWEKAVTRIATETGECVECARAGMACLECDPPKDVDHEPEPEPEAIEQL